MTDPDGNKAIVKFSRAKKEHFIGSDVDGKATKWTAHYNEGKWVEAKRKRKRRLLRKKPQRKKKHKKKS